MTFGKRLLMGLFFVGIVSLLLLFYMDRKMVSVLSPYVEMEVERFTKNLVEKTIQEKMIHYEKYTFDFKEKVGEDYTYQTNRLHLLQKEITEEVRKTLNQLEQGKIEEEDLPSFMKKGKFQTRKEGILCEVSMGSIRGSTLFANVGPTIPVRLFFMGGIHSNIDMEVSEYGLNNAVVKTSISVEITEQVTMPFSSKQKKIIVKIPLSVDLIPGEIPHYYQEYVK